MRKRQAVFRCDASPQIGGGHVMRCITLADELVRNGWDCAFTSSEESYTTVPLLKNYEASTTETADILIVDHYGLDEEFEGSQRTAAAKILVIDDLADRKHDCDILMDQTYMRAPSDYKPLTPAHCKILTGTDYALLRPQFCEKRESSLARREISGGEVNRVLVSAGSTNLCDITSKIIRALAQVKDKALYIDVVLGQNAAFMDNVGEAIASINKTALHKAVLHLDSKDMAGLMHSAGLAIGAGGTTSWERCCMGLPTLLIELADNQHKISEELHKAGAVFNLGWHDDVSEDKITEVLQAFCANGSQVLQMSRKAASLCDGKGAERVAAEIMKL